MPVYKGRGRIDYARMERDAVIGVAAALLRHGKDVIAGDMIDWSCRFGDEGHGSCTRGRRAITAEELEVAEKMAFA